MTKFIVNECDTQNRMTALKLEFLLYSFYSTLSGNYLASAKMAVLEALEWLANEGLLADRIGLDERYVITEKGRFHVNKLLNIPLPVQSNNWQ